MQQGPVAELARTLVDAVDADDPTLALDIERSEMIRTARAKFAADYFSRNAVQWDKIRSLYVDESEVERTVQEILPPGPITDLLDIGTGTGRIIEILGPRVGRAVGIDLSHEMLTVARSNLERKSLRNCVVQHGDMYQLPFPNKSFDAVTIHQVLHFAERPGDVIAEAVRVLRPGGFLVAADFLAHGLEFLRADYAHRWLGFDDGDVLAWCRQAGLKARAPIHLSGDPLTVGIWVSRRPANDLAQPAA